MMFLNDYANKAPYRQRLTLRERLTNWCAALGLVAIIALTQFFDARDAERYAQQAVHATAARVAATGVMHDHIRAEKFCKTPVGTEVLIMRRDMAAPGGFHCATYDNLSYGRAPFLVGAK